MTLSAFSAAWFLLSVYKLRCVVHRELSAKEFLTFLYFVHTRANSFYW